MMLMTVNVIVTRITSESTSALGHAATSGSLRTACGAKYRNAQTVVSATLVSDSVSRVVRRNPGAKSDEIGGIAWVLAAPCHSSGSGTAQRIHTVANAGATPTRKTHLGGRADT